MNEIFWLDEAIVKAMHEDQLAQHGGLSGIRDNNLFLASLDRPQNLLAYVVLTMQRLANGQETQETISEWLQKNSIQY